MLSILSIDILSVTSPGSNFVASPPLPNTRVLFAEAIPVTPNIKVTLNNKIIDTLLLIFLNFLLF
ncbi:hypothetical protein ES708_16817 [subsurface metagenome]